MTEPLARPRRGCLFYGCIGSVVLLLLVMGALLVGWHFVKRMVNHYTDTQPVALPTVQMPKGEVDRLNKRFEAFQAAVREQRPVEPLSLSADDVNVLIANGRQGSAVQGKIHVSLEGDQLRGQVSVPLQEVGLSMFKGRYFNGSATFNVSFQNGVLGVSARTLSVKQQPLPEVYMQKIRRENLAAAITNDPRAAAVLHGLEDIRVSDGRLVLVPKEKK